MERNFFGEYKPKNLNELHEAVELTGTDPSTASVMVDKEDDVYTAEIMTEDDRSYSLGPYGNLDAIKADLEDAGFEFVTVNE